MSNWKQDQQELAENAVRAVLPAAAATAVIECEAFGAVVGKLFRAEQDGADRAAVLAELDEDDVAFLLQADTPAAFLASRINY